MTQHNTTGIQPLPWTCLPAAPLAPTPPHPPPQTHFCLAQRLLEAAAREGKVAADVEAAAEAEWAQAEKRYREALAYNPDYFDAVCAIAQLEFDRAKLAAGLLVAPPEPPAK